ncbi:MAG: heavy metal sensor histidine kinase [Caenispirillum sp.]|nr:heavy metal sensor histidine kinase [Caenispirillum sp.]
MRSRSITFRLALLFSTASTIVLMVIGYWIGAAVETHFEEQDMHEFEGKLALVRHTLSKAHTAEDLDATARLLEDALVGHHGLSVSVVGPERRTLFATPDAALLAPLLENPTIGVDSGSPKPLVWSQGGRTYRGMVAAAAMAIPGSPPATVALALDIGHHLEFLAAFHRSLWLAVAVGILLTALLGWIAARRGLVPLRDMAQVAHGISASRLDSRLRLDDVPPELFDLAAAFNQMLDRLQDSFRRLSDFSSDLAHELRTPISNLMTETQVVLTRARSADEYREVLYSNLEEYDRLARMIGDMLFLAKADNGLIMLHGGPVDLAKEVRQLFDFYEALSEEKGVSLTLVGEGVVRGNDLMLRRALSNLLSNALRHSPRSGSIAVSIDRPEPEKMRIAVENVGQTIPAEHLPRLFDRFYQVDASRHRTHEGAGLGLAIVKSIVEAHGGRIAVTSADGVTRFEALLPAD